MDCPKFELFINGLQTRYESKDPKTSAIAYYQMLILHEMAQLSFTQRVFNITEQMYWSLIVSSKYRQSTDSIRSEVTSMWEEYCASVTTKGNPKPQVFHRERES